MPSLITIKIMKRSPVVGKVKRVRRKLSTTGWPHLALIRQDTQGGEN